MNSLLTSLLWILQLAYETETVDVFRDKQLIDPVSESREVTPRGHYGGLGYPYAPFFDPLTILAVLGFIAFIVQTCHSLYKTHHGNSGGNAGLVGGLLNNVLPGKIQRVVNEGRKIEQILNALQYYETLNARKKDRKTSKNISKHKTNSKSTKRV